MVRKCTIKYDHEYSCCFAYFNLCVFFSSALLLPSSLLKIPSSLYVPVVLD